MFLWNFCHLPSYVPHYGKPCYELSDETHTQCLQLQQCLNETKDKESATKPALSFHRFHSSN